MHNKAPLWTVLAFYLGLGVIAWVWDLYRGGETGLVLYDASRVWADAALGVGAGLGVVGLSQVMHKLSRAARELSYQMRVALGRLTMFDVLIYALTSSIGEELFFRGAMQPAIGYVATSIIFGLVHGFFVGKWALWTLFAIVMGFMLGWMTLFTGNLLAAILTHFVTNLLNLHKLSRLDPQEAAS